MSKQETNGNTTDETLQTASPEALRPFEFLYGMADVVSLASRLTGEASEDRARSYLRVVVEEMAELVSALSKDFGWADLLEPLQVALESVSQPGNALGVGLDSAVRRTVADALRDSRDLRGVALPSV